MNKPPRKIYHVHLHVKHNGENDFYFCSKSSISKEFGEDIIGVSAEYLSNTQIDPKYHYANSKCVITVITPK